MELPKRFKFKHKYGTCYIAEDCGETFRVSSYDGGNKFFSTSYDRRTAHTCIDNGTWEIFVDPTDPVEEAGGLKVGDHVVIKSPAHSYEDYASFAERHNLSAFRAGKVPTANRKGVVALIARHNEKTDKMIYAVRMGERGMFLMSRAGIEKESTPVCSDYIPTWVPNGFDGKGEPSMFTREQVGPGMRVEFNNGEVFLAIPNMQASTFEEEGPVALCRFGEMGYMNIDFAVDEGDDHSYDIAKVFAAPKLNAAFSCKNYSTELAKKQARALYLQEELVRASHNVVEWTERAQRIKEELRSI